MKIHLLTILFISTLLILSFSEKKTDTKVFIDNEITTIKMYIEVYSKNGYKVQNITSQPITAVCSSNGKCLTKGDIILIMTKD